jgi:hypothetical protein
MAAEDTQRSKIWRLLCLRPGQGHLNPVAVQGERFCADRHFRSALLTRARRRSSRGSIVIVINDRGKPACAHIGCAEIAFD